MAQFFAVIFEMKSIAAEKSEGVFAVLVWFTLTRVLYL